MINLQTKDHYIIARYLTDDVGLFRCKSCKKAFVLGCVYPDMNLFSYITGGTLRGHNYDCRRKYIAEELEKLTVKPSPTPAEAFRMGMLLHYIQDSFTYAHDNRFKGNINQHFHYETLLHNQMMLFMQNTAFAEIGSIESSSLQKRFDSLRGEYISRPKSINNDCAFILWSSISFALILKNAV